ncbi:TetR/AcrR family transcriptional regulator [Rugosimonospora africana]|uniref:TetR family transcriptional regulator n=1 Tax=Rugosimonospora africana TaxID=556532 RepID=A0A8J3R0N7_9ACTN|nr:TetR/AcrR family transcriptional regulator [Rugosimonospora africana]GIH19694.1 TetR family transcriptional regulator [Rugosimonospora africana]
MSDPVRAPSARQQELLELAYKYALEHGLAELSLRPLAAAIGSSPRVLLFLFGSKDDLIRALLGRARSSELAMLTDLRTTYPDADLAAAATHLWRWLSAAEHRDLLRLWVEGYARSLVEPSGPWAGFAASTVQDWLDVLAEYQPARSRHGRRAVAQRTTILAVLRGALFDLLATGDDERVGAAVTRELAHQTQG